VGTLVAKKLIYHLYVSKIGGAGHCFSKIYILLINCSIIFAVAISLFVASAGVIISSVITQQ